VRRLVWEGGSRFSLQEVRPPEAPLAGRVRVRVRAVGVCGTDIHILSGEFPLARPPLVLGHEIAGEIDAVGEGVERVRPGDRVTVDQVIGCGACFFCRRGSRQFCENGYEMGITADGGSQDFIELPESNVYPIPDTISFEEAAILDMEVYGALKKGGVGPGDVVAVFGHGPAGLVACQEARALGAARVILCGRSRARLQGARTIGVADRYLSAEESNVVEAIRAETGGRGADVAVECAGSPRSIADAIQATVAGGRVVLYGIQNRPVPNFDLDAVVLKDLTIYGSIADRVGWEEVIDLAHTGRLRLGPLITHRFPLEAAPAAYDLVRRRAEGVIKAVLVLALRP
jgi:threonine dehydrogenase-like Zn-dependent dehydrogenase